MPKKNVISEGDLVHWEGDAKVEECHYWPAHEHHQGNHTDRWVEHVPKQQ